jgi:hypothetical protein
MTAPHPDPRRRTGLAGIGAGVAALAACALCCAGPLLALLGGVGLLSAAGAVFIPVLAILALAAAVGVIWLLRRRRAAACRIPAGVVELGTPTLPPARQPPPIPPADEAGDLGW